MEDGRTFSILWIYGWICQFSNVTGQRGEGLFNGMPLQLLLQILNQQAVGTVRSESSSYQLRTKLSNTTSLPVLGYGCYEEFVCVIGCSQGLTSSTRPKPPTPSVAITSSWSKGLEEGNGATNSFSRMTSGDSGWLWWRDTDLFLDNDDNTNQIQC